MLTKLHCASLEGTGSLLMVWFLGISTQTLTTANAGIYGAAYFAITITIVLTLILHVLGPITGGHLNPVITISMVITGVTPPLKGLAYIIGQMIGATLGGFVLATSLGPRAAHVENYGCFFHPSPAFDMLQASLLEFMGTFFYVSLMYGFSVNESTYNKGSKLPPLLNSITLGILLYATSSFVPVNSYAGASGFPTRCWATSIGVFKFGMHDLIHWVPSLTASVFHGLVHRYLNPYDEARSSPVIEHEDSKNPKIIVEIEGPYMIDVPLPSSELPEKRMPS